MKIALLTNYGHFFILDQSFRNIHIQCKIELVTLFIQVTFSVKSLIFP